MEKVVNILMDRVKDGNLSSLASTPLLSNVGDPFHGIIDKTVVVRKQKVYLKGRQVYVRRVFVRDENAVDYRYIGWVVDGDCDFCFICANEYTLFNRRHHCRICGDLVCENCSTGQVYISEFHYFGLVRACDHCYFGQDECSISITPEEDDVSRYRQSLDISSRSKSATNFGLKKQSSSEQFDSSSNRKSQEPTHVYSSPEIKPTPLQENEDSVRAFPPPSPRVISTHKVNFDRDDAVDVETNDTVDHMAEEYNTSHSTFPDASSHVLQYKGYPYCVLKTRTTTSGDKVFINICFHSTIPGLDIIIGEDCPRTVLGKGGEMCYVYDVCVGKASLEDNVIQNDTYNRVVRLLNTACRAKLEDQFSIPKIKKNFKGDHSSHFIQTEGMPTPPTSPDHKQKAPVSPVANGGSNDSSNGDISGDDSGESKRIDESSLPASYRGWVLREEGTLLKSFKRRYMVLDRGVLTSYKNPTTADDADDLIARESEGKTMSFTIDSFTTLELIEGRNKAKLTSTQLYLRDGKDNRTDMLFDTDSIEDHSGWVQAILLHMEYIKQARRRNSV